MNIKPDKKDKYKLITFCEEEEYNHRLKCKRYDDASGYTRSKDKSIRTASAVIEDNYADFYKEISDTIRKYQKIKEVVEQYKKFGNIDFSMQIISGVVEDGNND